MKITINELDMKIEYDLEDPVTHEKFSSVVEDIECMLYGYE